MLKTLVKAGFWGWTGVCGDPVRGALRTGFSPNVLLARQGRNNSTPGGR